jgi:TatD DNase family protein
VRLFDSHAHLDMGRGGREEARGQLERAWLEGLEGIVAIAGATRVGEYDDTVRLARSEPRLWAAAGIHPHTGDRATPAELERLRFALDERCVVALGEIGLDYHYNHSDPAEQRRAFARQLRLAHEAALPVVIHTRDADHDTLAILRDEGAGELGGVIHCFSSGEELANGALELDFFVSFSGIVTFGRAESVREAARRIPADRILAETDSPFLSPVPYRGRPNEPARVRHVVERLADLRGVEPDEMGGVTADNARVCFRLDEDR